MMLINSGFVHCVLYKAEVGQVVQELDTGSYFGEINCLPAVLRGLIDARVSVAGIYLYLCLSIHPSIDRSIYLHIYLSIYRSIDLSIYLSMPRSQMDEVRVCVGYDAGRCRQDTSVAVASM